MKFRTLAATFAAVFLTSQAQAQSVPPPRMNIPEASSTPGFTMGAGLALDYVTNAKCNVSGFAVSCTSASASAFALSPSLWAQLDRVRLQVTIPVVDIEGPGTLTGVLNGGPQISGTATGPTTRRTGLGDISVGGAVILLPESAFTPRLEIGGVVKLPTGRNGLGTGQRDYGLQLMFYHQLGAGFQTFGSVGRQWITDPVTLHQNSAPGASLGLEFNHKYFGAGAELDYSQSMFAGLPHSLSIEPYVTWRPFGSDLGIQVYTAFGLTDSTPNHGIGFRLVL